MEPTLKAQGWVSSEGPWYAAAILAALLGLGLMVDQLLQSSATYDEVAYLRVAARWWRTGDQESITRMGSPLTFWKIQQVPVFWALDRAGFRDLIDHPMARQESLLPLVRLWSLWLWLAAFGLTASWSRRLYGPRAMALAAACFALSPNLLAHGALVTMELPLTVCTTAIFFLFWAYLQTGRRTFFCVAAALSGLGLSCKFTTLIVPPILAVAWTADRWRRGQHGAAREILNVTRGMVGFLAIMLLANWAITGFARLPLSEATGQHPTLETFDEPWRAVLARVMEWPIPQDWVGIVTQMRHQRSGGPSYLFGQRRMTGWWYYYFIAVGVKVPLSFWLLAAGRALLGRRPDQANGGTMLPLVIGLFLLVTATASSRNYGLRYLLPLAPLAIIWVSALADAGRWATLAACLALAGQAVAVAAVHPYELSYFNCLAGGPAGGRRILADSNLDWGQGAKALARLQRERPEFRNLTLYYFGDTDPGYYRVAGRRYVIDASDLHPHVPRRLAADTPFLAVSTSLQWGPWGEPGYFRCLDGVRPIAMVGGQTIAIYRVADIPAFQRLRTSIPRRPEDVAQSPRRPGR